MTPRIRTWVNYLLLSGICGLTGFSVSYHVPQLKSWVLNEVSTFTRDHGPALLFAHQLNFHLFPLGISLDDVRIVPKMPLRKDLDAVHVAHIQAGIDPSTLLTGHLGISQISIDDVHVRYRIHASTRKKTNENIQIPFHEIFNTPVHDVHITRLHGQLTHVDERWVTSTEDLDLLVENRRSGLMATLQPTHLRVQTAQGKEIFDETATLATRVQISEDGLSVVSLRFDKDDSSLSVSGNAQGDLAHLQITASNWDGDVQIEANPLQHSLFPLIAKLNLPAFDGRVEAKATVTTQENRAPSIQGQLRTRDLKVGGFFVGNVSTVVNAENQKIVARDVHVRSPAADIHVRDLKLQLGNEPTIAGTLQFAGMDLREFLNQVKVKNIPIHLITGADLPCAGSLKPLVITCDGVATGQNLRVFNERTHKTIVAAEKFQLKGSVELNSTGVFPKAALNLGDQSLGRAEGYVKFAEGFKFTYHTDNLFFKDLKNLADLRLEGSATVDGSTEGDGDHGLIDMKIASHDFWFENYGVGNVQGEVHYKKDKLSLLNLDGLFRTSRFRGNLSVDLDKNQIDAQAQIPYIELSDLERMLARKVTLPVIVLGSGVADLKIHGPLDFPRLSYSLHSNFTNLTVANEHIPEATFNLSAVDGHVKTDHVELRKKHGAATLRGTAEPSGQANLQVEGRSLQLEDSQILNALGMNLQGQLNFDLSLKGPILAPDARMNGSVTKAFIGQEPVGDSNFQTEFFRNYLSSRGNLFGQDIAFDFQIPFTPTAPFRLKLDAAHWNLAPLVSLVSADGPSRDFKANVSTHIDLKSSAGGFWKSTGYANIETLKIQKGKLQVQSVEPLKAEIKQGVITFPPWKFRGDNTLFQIEARRAEKDHLNFALTGKVELAVFSFVTPFFTDFRGTLSLSMQTIGKSDDINLVGTALVENGYIRLKAFPHPFEDIRTDAIFNKNQLIINSLSMNLAGGHTFGEGAIRFEGSHNVPVQLHGRIENAQFDVPAGVHTQGSGDFQISGDWFPYLLSGNFDVQDGLFTRAFDGGDVSGPLLPRATLLPRFVTEKDVDALRFNLQTNLTHGLVVRNSLMDAQLKGHLQVKGTTNKPILGGELDIVQGGQLYFHETPFEISAGNVKFTDARENNPSIYITANSHVQLYDVGFLAQGPASDLKISLQSTPPLGPREIISLLALGEAPDAGHIKDYNNGQADNTHYQAGAAILSNNPFGKELKKRTGFDVKFSSAVDDTDKAAVPMIVVRKEFTPKLNMSASHSLGALVSENVKLEYKLNEKLSAVGSWEDKTYTEENGSPAANTNYFGLDLQYRLQFK